MYAYVLMCVWIYFLSNRKLYTKKFNSKSQLTLVNDYFYKKVHTSPCSIYKIEEFFDELWLN